MVAASILELQHEIERTATVNQAVIALIKDMIERLEEMAQHPDAAKIRELAQQLRTHTDALAHAVDQHEE